MCVVRIEHIYHGDILVSTDRNGTGYYKVLRTNRVTIDVLCENGNRARMSPALFDRKVSYIPEAFARPAAELSPPGDK